MSVYLTLCSYLWFFFFFSSRRRHTRCLSDWSSTCALPISETMLRALPKAEHVPSYAAVEPALKDIPPLERDLQIPSYQPPSAVRLARQKTTAPVSVAKTSDRKSVV